MFRVHYVQYYNGELRHEQEFYCNYARIVQLLNSFRELAFLYRTNVEIYQGDEFIMGAI